MKINLKRIAFLALRAIYAILILIVIVGLLFRSFANRFGEVLLLCIFILIILAFLHLVAVCIYTFIIKKFRKGVLLLLLIIAVVLFYVFIVKNVLKVNSVDSDIACKASLRGAQSALELYYTHYKYYPDNLETLIKEGYLQEKGDKDPWGSKFNYKYSKPNDDVSNNYSLKSNGPDGKPDTADDIDAPVKSNIRRSQKSK